MKDKISVGEYIRTKDGIIDKVIIAYNEKCHNPNCSEKHISCQTNYYCEEEIAKHSKNIIDLIEVGDYVNGVRILDVTGDYIHTAEWDCCKARLENKLHSIVTKEQFKEMEYRV